MLVLLLALPAMQGQARAQDEKEPPSPKMRYAALLKDFSAQQRELVTAINKAQGEERQKLIQKLPGLGKDFAEKFFKLAEDDPKGPVALNALVWVLQNGPGSAVAPKAAERLVENYPENPVIERLCQALANSRDPKAADALKPILEKSTKPRVKAAAALGLGKQLAARTDTLGDKIAEANKVAAEAEKYLAQAIDLYGNDNAALKSAAEKELKALRTLRVGKEAPEITATDLDEKEFKLSDYRGKVVLLDFWGNW
jgi:ABC-type Na+ efflux pump permease subunit